MPATIVLGGQWGDEGKGKLTDALAQHARLVVRANGGSNAGHTVTAPQGVFKLHLVPSGILNPDCIPVIGAGVVIDPGSLVAELDGLEAGGIETSQLVISDRAHLVLPYHKAMDRAQEILREDRAIGTTLRGIGPAYADKAARQGLRVVDLLDDASLQERVQYETDMHNIWLTAVGMEPLDAGQIFSELSEAGARLRRHVASAELIVQDALDQGSEVIIECAQGAMLDIDYGGYPYVTSSSPTAAGACQGAGVAPTQVKRVVAVMKAYSTRVGAGEMPTELFDETGQLIRERGREYGTTTGRARRTGWFDAVSARRTVRLNGVTEIALTLLDVLDVFEQVLVCTSYELDGIEFDLIPGQQELANQLVPIYEILPGWLSDTTSAREKSDLPEQALGFIQFLEKRLGAPITMVGVGPAREQLVSLTDASAIASISATV